MSLQRGINFRALAEKMGQCSGAEVRGICTEAGMYALRERRQYVGQEDFEMAVAKVSTAMRLSFRTRTTSDFLPCHNVTQVLKRNAEGNTSVNRLYK